MLPAKVAPDTALDVLVVDDERRALRNLEHLVLREPDVRRCDTYAGGAEAVERIVGAERRPDIVFLDVQMPEVDGFDVVRRVGSERMPPCRSCAKAIPSAPRARSCF